MDVTDVHKQKTYLDILQGKLDHCKRNETKYVGKGWWELAYGEAKMVRQLEKQIERETEYLKDMMGVLKHEIIKMDKKDY